MSEAAFRNLVDKLYTKTVRREINWQTTDNKYYWAYFSNGSVRMMSRPGEFELDDYVITIYNHEGAVTDEFTDGSIEMRDENNNLVYYPRMQEMYNSARRQVTGADKVLRSILDELQ